MSRRLLVTDGGREREVLVVATVVVGRDPTCDITGNDDLLSRRHAEFALASGGVLVRDLGSRNGVFVNGTRTVELALESNDVVQIGQLKIRYVSDDRPIAPPPVQAAPFSVVDEDLTTYTPAPAGAAPPAVPPAADDEATSFVPALRAATARMPMAAPTPVQIDAAPRPVATPRAVVEPRLEQMVRSQGPSLLPSLAVVIVSVGVLVWQASQSGLALWLVVPLTLALAGSAAVGAALVIKSSGMGLPSKNR